MVNTFENYLAREAAWEALGEVGREAAIRRFWERVEQRDGCWIYVNKTDRTPVRRYGHFWAAGHTWLAHRFSLAIDEGRPLPFHLTVDHLCLVKACVFPEHLELVPQIENSRRYTASRTHCVNGHPYTQENIYVIPGSPGWRACLTCRRAKSRAWHEDQRRAV
jgi:hypothetical protein